MADVREHVLLESSLLKLLSKRNVFDNYYDVLDKKSLLSTTEQILKSYASYFDDHTDTNEIDFGDLYSYVAAYMDDRDYYLNDVVPKIQSATSESMDVVLANVLKMKTESTLKSLLESGRFNPDEIRDILDVHDTKYNKLIKKFDEELITASTVNMDVLDKTEGITWFLPTLQDSLGSLVMGQLVVVSADVGTGKSAFVVSQVAHTLQWLKENNMSNPILYFNSEGTSADVFGRMYSNMYRNKYRGGFEEIVVDRDRVRQNFIEEYTDKLFYVSQLDGQTFESVRNKVKKHSPSLVIIDITDTLAPEESPQMLKKVFDRLRVLAGITCPIIATTQAGDQTYKDQETGEERNRKYLSQKATYGSKVGKPGAADTMITIGKDDHDKHMRYIATPKKKRGKEVFLQCRFTEEYSLYEEYAW